MIMCSKPCPPGRGSSAESETRKRVPTAIYDLACSDMLRTGRTTSVARRSAARRPAARGRGIAPAARAARAQPERVIVRLSGVHVRAPVLRGAHCIRTPRTRHPDPLARGKVE